MSLNYDGATKLFLSILLLQVICRVSVEDFKMQILHSHFPNKHVFVSWTLLEIRANSATEELNK